MAQLDPVDVYPVWHWQVRGCGHYSAVDVVLAAHKGH